MGFDGVFDLGCLHFFQTKLCWIQLPTGKFVFLMFYKAPRVFSTHFSMKGYSPVALCGWTSAAKCWGLSLQWQHKGIAGVPSWLLLKWTLGSFLKSWSFTSGVSNIWVFFLPLFSLRLWLMFWRPWWLESPLLLSCVSGLPGEGAFLLPSSPRESPWVVGAFMGLHGWWGIASQSCQFGIPTTTCHDVSLPRGFKPHGFSMGSNHRGRDEFGVPSQFSEAAAAILLAASENSERGGKGVEGKQRLGWGAGLVAPACSSKKAPKMFWDSPGFIFVSCKLNN